MHRLQRRPVSFPRFFGGKSLSVRPRGREVVFVFPAFAFPSFFLSPPRHHFFSSKNKPSLAQNATTPSRQFSHRVKGVSLATFKPEEVAALEETGNALVLGTYLARWSPSDLPKPTGREPARIADWVEAVFVRKRFYAEPDIGSGRVSVCHFFIILRERVESGSKGAF